MPTSLRLTHIIPERSSTFRFTNSSIKGFIVNEFTKGNLYKMFQSPKPSIRTYILIRSYLQRGLSPKPGKSVTYNSKSISQIILTNTNSLLGKPLRWQNSCRFSRKKKTPMKQRSNTKCPWRIQKFAEKNPHLQIQSNNSVNEIIAERSTELFPARRFDENFAYICNFFVFSLRVV